MKISFASIKLLVSICLMVLIALFILAILPKQPIADELIHLPQIMTFISGSTVLSGIVAMPPGFHYTIATVAGALNLHELNQLRAINTLITLICPILFGLYIYADKGRLELMRSAQLMIAPIIWPFFFLLYTDLSSLLLILIGLLLVQQRRFVPAALVCTLSLAFRQNNIFWVLLLWLIAMVPSVYSRIQSGHASPRHLHLLNVVRDGVKKTAVFIFPVVAFLIFVYLNGGVAMGNKDLHHTSGIYPTQIFFFLLVFWFVLLPLHIRNLPKIYTLLQKHLFFLIGAIGLLALIYLVNFDISHPYNFRSDYFIRNWLLYKLNDNLLWRVLAFIPMVWALISLATTKLLHPKYYWLYPITLLSLLPVHLIEQRYYIIPLALFLLFRIPTSKFWEATLLAWEIILSVLVTYGIASLKIFL